MKTAIARSTGYAMTADTPRERELFTVMGISGEGVDVFLSETAVGRRGSVLHLRDAMACAVMVNLLQVAHRRMQEIELARLQTSGETANGAASAAGPAVGPA